jgi:type II secretory pathway pseudopilin PulG
MFGIGSVIKSVLMLVIVLIVAGGLWYVINIKADLAVSEQNNQRLQESVASQNRLIEQMQQDIQQIQNINQDLQAQNKKQAEDVQVLTNKFSVNAKGETRDFGQTAAAKPQVVEKIVNRGSTNAARCLELASGAPLNEQEKNAKTPREANRECPSLIDPNYKPILP